MTAYSRAVRLACKMHALQTYNNGPYSDHLHAVEMVLCKFGYPEDWYVYKSGFQNKNKEKGLKNAE